MLKEISLSDYVNRAHTVPFQKEQSLASHMGRCAMIALWLKELGYLKLTDSQLIELYEYLITHDLHETEFGDIPYPTKCKFQIEEPEFKPISDELRPIAKLIDMLEFYLKCLEEIKLGNSHWKLLEVKDRAKSILQDLFKKAKIPQSVLYYFENQIR